MSSWRWSIPPSTTRTAWSSAASAGWSRRYPHVPGVDFAGTVLESRHAALPAGRQGGAHRLAGRRSAMGRLGAECRRRWRLAGAVAGRNQHARRHGHRHRRPHRDAGGHGARTTRPRAWLRRAAGHWRGGWRRFGSDRNPGAPRLRGGGVDRPRRNARLSAFARRADGHRSRRRSRRRPNARWRASAGPAASTRSAATRWRACWRSALLGAPWPRSDWPAGRSSSTA